MGLPKSNKPWKGLSERSGKHKKMNPKTWQQKMDDKRRLKSVREKVREERDKVKNSVRHIAWSKDMLYRNAKSPEDSEKRRS